MEPVFFASAREFRDWLESNHGTAGELWVGFHRRATGRPSMTWPESIDQALCFGWIDGIRRSLDAESYAIRFTPRKSAGNWSAVNVARAGELARAGLMTPAGMRAFESSDAERTQANSAARAEAELEPAQEAQLRASAAAWNFWESQAPSYRRVAAYWVVSAKRDDTRQRRLDTLIADCAAGRRLAAVTLERRG
jgi:uncharacterized protein YdeI (YjbR/CyaY-like superfamily)